VRRFIHCGRCANTLGGSAQILVANGHLKLGGFGAGFLFLLS